MAAALAQAMKVLARSGATDSGTNSVQIDPQTLATLTQALKVLTQSASEGAQATTNAPPVIEAEKAARNVVQKSEDSDTQAEAQAELAQAQQMADAAMAQASQAAATAASDPLGSVNQSSEGHNSLNGLIMSAHSLDPDPSDDNHHSMDSLF